MDVHMIRQIQYLRALAAMMVVWHHAQNQVVDTQKFILPTSFGAYGVDLFFMISGFIMLVTTWDKPIGPVDFMKHRIRRVVPLYWAATLLVVVMAIAWPGMHKTLKFDTVSFFKSLFFIPYESLIFPGMLRPLLAQGWTLNYEMFFYALFAVALLVVKGWRVPVMVGVLSLLVACGFIFHPTSAALQVYTDYRLLEFGVGMILGRLWVMKTRAASVGGNTLLSALGDASYSIYLTHTFTLVVLRSVWIRLVPNASMASSVSLMAVSLTVCAFAGWLCYLFVEKPLINWLGHRHQTVKSSIGTMASKGAK